MNKINWQKGLFLIYIIWAVVIVACWAPTATWAEVDDKDIWTSKSGKTIKAKFIEYYFLTDFVILEKPNGERVGILKSNLCEKDSLYVDNLMRRKYEINAEAEGSQPPVLDQPTISPQLQPEQLQPKPLESDLTRHLREALARWDRVKPREEPVTDDLTRRQQEALARFDREPALPTMPAVPPEAPTPMPERPRIEPPSELRQRTLWDDVQSYFQVVGPWYFLYLLVGIIALWPIYYVLKWIHKKSALFWLDVRQRAVGVKKRWQRVYYVAKWNKRRIIIVAGLIVFLAVGLFPEWDGIRYVSGGQDQRYRIGRHIIWPPPESESWFGYYRRRPVINYHRALLELSIVVVLTLGLVFVLGDTKKSGM